MTTLGIETSCDETACGIVDEGLNVLANAVYSQVDTHALYGGVVPEIAARAHLEKISPIVQQALSMANLNIQQIDRIAFTRGPGLLGALLVGAAFAKSLARYLDKPLIGIHHLEGHLGTAYLTEPNLKPPFVCLVVSGGHTEFCRVNENFQYIMLGKTRDDAAGEAFDKTGKILGLGYPAGPLLAKLAENGNRDFIPLPKALDQKGSLEFSFSGLKTAVLRYTQTQNSDFLKANLPSICASIESAIVEILVKKALSALKQNDLHTLAVVGGVSANKYLRQRMTEELGKRGMRAVFPPAALSGDNGAMIAAMAQKRANENAFHSELTVSPSLAWTIAAL